MAVKITQTKSNHCCKIIVVSLFAMCACEPCGAGEGQESEERLVYSTQVVADLNFSVLRTSVVVAATRNSPD